MDRAKFNLAEGTALYAEIRRAISEGEAMSGEHMPLAKDLAKVLGVITNIALRDIGIWALGIAGAPERDDVMTRVKELVVFARRQGR